MANLIYKTKNSEKIIFNLGGKSPVQLNDYLRYDFADRCEHIRIDDVKISFIENEGIHEIVIYYSVLKDFKDNENIESFFRKALLNYNTRVYKANYEVDLDEMFGFRL